MTYHILCDILTFIKVFWFIDIERRGPGSGALDLVKRKFWNVCVIDDNNMLGAVQGQRTLSDQF